MTAPSSSILTFSGVGLTWPDGDTVIDGLDLLVPSGLSGLVGVNGSGKSTLLRLAAGVLAPTRGSVQVTGEMGYLPQDLTLDRGRMVDDLLGIAAPLRALRRLDAGSGDPADLEAVGDDWDVEERATAELARLGLSPDVLDRRVGRAVRRRGGPPRPRATAASPSGRAAPRRADQQPRCTSARRSSTTSSARGPAPCSWSAMTGSCSSGWTGSATCGTDRCGGTAAGSARTPSRSAPSSRPPSRPSRQPAPTCAARRPTGSRQSACSRRGGARAGRPSSPEGSPRSSPAPRRTPRRTPPRAIARSTSNVSRPPGTGSTPPRPGSVRTERSGSTCRTRRCPGAGSCSPPRTSSFATASPSSSSWEGRTGSRSSAPTARARPRCSTRSPARCLHAQAPSAPRCRWRCCPSASTCSTRS